MKLRRLSAQLRHLLVPYSEPKRPVFEVDSKLIGRQELEAKKHPVNGIRGRKRLIEDQPDTFVRPIDYDAEPPPV